MERLTARRVKELAQLHRARERRATGRWLLEGATLLGEALDAGLRCTLVAAGERPAREEAALLERARVAGAELCALDPGGAAKLADRVNGPELFAVVERPRRYAGELPAEGQPALVLGLCGLQDPGNVGTLLRSARAFGAHAVLLGDGGVEPGSPKVLRASAGAAFALPLGELSLAPALAEVGLIVCGALAPGSEERAARPDTAPGVATSAPQPVDAEGAANVDRAMPARCLLLLGHETRGLREVLPGLTPRAVGVPQDPRVESLNVAVAGSILMADWYRAHAETRAERPG